MKRLLCLVIVIFVALLLLPVASTFAQTSKVPITYPGDTEETIARRARWIEEAKKEGSLDWWGTLSPPLKEKIIAEFNKIYPFIKVDHWRGRGEEIASKLETEHTSGRYSVDIILGGEPNNYPRWRKTGMIAKFTDIIPGIEKIPQTLYGKFGDSFIPGNNAATPQYNTNLVSPAEAPKNWENLLDPKWKGHIGMTTDPRPWSVLALAEGGWGIEKTENFLRKLAKQNPIWARGHSAGHTLLIAGEFKIFAEDNLYHIFNSRDRGAPVDWVRVSPVPITSSSFILSSKAHHPNAAKLFLEWLCSPIGLTAWDKITSKGIAFPGSGTRTSKALEGLDLCYRTEEVILKTIETSLYERLSKALGVAK